MLTEFFSQPIMDHHERQPEASPEGRIDYGSGAA